MKKRPAPDRSWVTTEIVREKASFEQLFMRERIGTWHMSYPTHYMLVCGNEQASLCNVETQTPSCVIDGTMDISAVTCTECLLELQRRVEAYNRDQREFMRRIKLEIEDDYPFYHQTPA